MKQGRTGDQTREQILETAEEVFSRKGYSAATLDDIAAVVGIRRPSLLYHYPDKHSIYRAVLARQYSRQAAFITVKKRPDFATSAEYLDYLIDRSVDFFCTNPATLRIDLYNLLSDDNEEVNPRDLAETGVQVWQSALKQAVAEGTIRNVPVPHVFALISGMVAQYLLMSPSVGLIDRKLAYATHDRKNINKMRENLRLALWGMLKLEK
jgi:TetR/AcrR family transcriptional regulator